MNKIYFILAIVLFACLGCEWHLRSDRGSDHDAFVARYDRLEALYLLSGDISALQQMQTLYPRQTRRLIEDVLQLGTVDEANINARFYAYFQDTTLQQLIEEVGRQYGEMEKLDKQLSDAFKRLCQIIPDVEMPVIYTQIGSLDQSIVVDDGMVGISLDKYLGADYPSYTKYGYSEEQRSMMTRDYIVPDCLGFYLLSIYPSQADSLRQQHMGRIQLTVNQVLQRPVFSNEHVLQAKQHLKDAHISFKELLEGK